MGLDATEFHRNYLNLTLKIIHFIMFPIPTLLCICLQTLLHEIDVSRTVDEWYQEFKSQGHFLAVPYKHWQLLDYIKSMKLIRALKPLLVISIYNVCSVEKLHDSEKDSVNQISAIVPN